MAGFRPEAYHLIMMTTDDEGLVSRLPTMAGKSTENVDSVRIIE